MPHGLQGRSDTHVCAPPALLQCLPWIMAQIKGLSAGHPVAEVFLIGFCFAYLVEGEAATGRTVTLHTQPP
jgi:hypothetical protein